MALAKESPVYQERKETLTDSEHAKAVLADKNNIVKQYALHVIKYINGTCNTNTR